MEVQYYCYRSDLFKESVLLMFSFNEIARTILGIISAGVGYHDNQNLSLISLCDISMLNL